MKIIKEGELNIVQFSCPYCGCEFTADFTDYSVKTITRFTPKRGFRRVKVFEVECPRCDNDVKAEKD